MTGNAQVTSSLGDIQVTGHGAAGIGGDNRGISVQGGSTIVSTGSAKITVDGTGADGAFQGIGIFVGDTNSAIRSVNGNMLITGHAGSGGFGNMGINVQFGGSIESTGTATIKVDGTGGGGTDSNYGIRILGSDAFIRSVKGDIEVVGMAGAGTTVFNSGVMVQGGGSITSTSTAKVTVTGTGGTGVFEGYFGVGQLGVWVLDTTSTISSKDGDIQVTGTGGGSAGSSGNFGVRLQSGVIQTTTDGIANVTVTGTPGVGTTFGIYADSGSSTVNVNTSAGTGNINLIADGINLDVDSFPASISAGTHLVTIRPKSVGVAINLGGADASGILGLTDAELDRITAGTLVIGNVSSGPITVSSDITRPVATNMQLISGGNVAIGGGQINTSGGSLFLHPGTSPNAVRPIHAGVDVTASTLTFGSDLAIEINGPVVDTGYTQLKVVGSIDLTGVDLIISGSYAPLSGDTFIIVDNDGSDPIIGTFNGLDEGAIINVNGVNKKITYVGGTNGNDVLLLASDTPPVAVNDNPVAVADSKSTAEDTALSFPASDLTGNDTDVDGDSLTLTSVAATANTHGTVALVSGVVTYTPAANYNGPASFDYTISDGNGGTATGTVNVTVTSVNDNPVAVADSKSTAEDNVLTFPASDLVANDTDMDGDSLTVTAVTATANTHGTVALVAGVITYTPVADFNGSASFDYTVSDGHGGTDTGTVNVTVNPVNDNPVAVADSKSTAEDTVLTFPASDLTANDTDVDGDSLTVTSVAATANTHGTVALVSGVVTYTPAANYNGPASFDYSISDGHGGTATGTVNVTVSAVNDNPVAVADSKSTAEDTALSFPASDLTGNDTDVDGDSLTVTSVAATANTHGTVALVSGVVTYTPAANYNGPASFDYSISDGHGGTATGTVNVTVTAVNDNPVAVADSKSTAEDTVLTFPASDLTANDTDVDGDSLTVTSVAATANTHGTVALVSGVVTYTPAANDNGTASFDYSISDGHGGTATGTVNVTVTAVNDNPVAVNDTKSTAEDTVLTFPASDLTANDTDVDGDSLTVTSVAATANTHGTVALVSGVVTYTPAANYNGPASFDYTVSDGHGGTDAGTVNVTINPVNDAPVAVDDSKSTNEDTALVFNASDLVVNDTDVDGDNLTVTAVTPNGNIHGTVALVAGVITYTPAANYNGSASFDYTVSDGHGGTDTGTVNVTVNSVNDAPVAVDDSKSTNEDTALVFNASDLVVNDTDVDGDSLTVTAVTSTANTHGTVALVAGVVTYTPAANYNGSASFDYTVSDGHGGSDTGTVTVTITAVNDAPVAQAGSLTTAQDTAKNGTLVATDVDSSSLTYRIVSGPAHGSVVPNQATGAYVYTPAAGYTGADSFTFKANDGSLDSNEATVSISVNLSNLPPVITSGSTFKVFENSAFSTTITTSDPDGDTVSLSLTGGADQLRFTLVDNVLGLVAKDYENPDDANQDRVYQVQITANDGRGGTAVKNLTIALENILEDNVHSFDFQTPGSAGQTALNHTPITEATTYSAAVAANAYAGYYWVSGTVSSFDRGTLNPSSPTTSPDLSNLMRDGNLGTGTGVFQANLLPNTAYDVTWIVGDKTTAHDQMNLAVLSGGSFTGGDSLTGQSTAIGVFKDLHFAVLTDSSGLLKLQFTAGGSNSWVVNGLEFVKHSAVGQLTITGAPAGVAADASLTDDISVTGYTPGATYDVKTTLGSSTSNDMDSRLVSTQLVAPNSGTWNITIRRPYLSNVNGDVTSGTVTIQEVTGRSSGQAAISYSANPATASGTSVRKIDFNAITNSATGTSSSTASGYTPVLGADLYSPATGYGWNTPAIENYAPNASLTNPSRDEDYHSGSSVDTFQLRLNKPTTPVNYAITIYSYNPSSIQAISMKVRAEGGAVTDITVPKQTLLPTVLTISSNSISADGILDLQFDKGTTAGTLGKWVVSGIDVVIPQLSAQGAATNTQHAATVSSDQLQRIADAALARFTAAGVSAAELALLKSVQFQIQDLGGSGYLGLATGGLRVQIDDNGAGYGWFIDATPSDNKEFRQKDGKLIAVGKAKQQMDLLSVVMHEFTNVLKLNGHQVPDSLSDAEHVSLGLGQRWESPSASSLDSVFAEFGTNDEIKESHFGRHTKRHH